MRFPEITINRCRLRIVRRGGWSWGHDPKVLTRAAIDELPMLIARQLGQLATSEDIELADPVEARVRVRLADLYRFAQEPEQSGPVSEEIGNEIARSMRNVLGAQLGRASSVSPGSERSLSRGRGGETGEVAAGRAERADTERPGRALLQLLIDWDAREELLHRISTLPRELIEQWLGYVLETWEPPSAARNDGHEAGVRSVCERTRDIRVLLSPGRHRQVVRSLVLLVRLSVAGRFDRQQVKRLLAEQIPVEPDHSVRPGVLRSGEQLETRESAATSTSAESRPTRTPAAGAGAAAADRSPAEFVCDIPCALPFLTLVPLAKVGYLGALNAALDAGRAMPLAHAFGASLARKSLSPPEHGWLRSPLQQVAAGCFAGRHESVPDSEIASALLALRAQWPLLDQFIATNLIAGHRSEAAWVVCRDVTDNLVLFDSDGLFPVATGTAQQLAVLVAPSGSRVVLADDLERTSVAEALDSLQIRHRICNDERCEQAVASWNAILADRPGLSRGTEISAESSLTLAASLALGSIAWTLWHDRESVHPLLAIERFHDFDARVHVTADAVHVRLPLGKRFWHLRDHGLLSDVSDVPWLGGRVVHFGAA